MLPRRRSCVGCVLRRDAERDKRDPRRKRAAAAAAEDPSHRGSHDVGDAMTTNLYVGNLAPSVGANAHHLLPGGSLCWLR